MWHLPPLLLLLESTARFLTTFIVHQYFHVLPQLSEALTLNRSQPAKHDWIHVSFPFWVVKACCKYQTFYSSSNNRYYNQALVICRQSNDAALSLSGTAQVQKSIISPTQGYMAAAHLLTNSAGFVCPVLSLCGTIRAAPSSLSGHLFPWSF